MKKPSDYEIGDETDPHTAMALAQLIERGSSSIAASGNFITASEISNDKKGKEAIEAFWQFAQITDAGLGDGACPCGVARTHLRMAVAIAETLLNEDPVRSTRCLRTRPSERHRHCNDRP
jgi:hypothetical protein